MSANSAKAALIGSASRPMVSKSLDHADALPVLDMLGLNDWPRLLLETGALLGTIYFLRSWLAPGTALEGMPHPYWIPVLLASTQYGLSGGMVAAAAASVLCFFDLSAPSATQDFYAYAGVAAVQPAMWFGGALVLGGLRNLSIQQLNDVSDQLVASRCRSDDLAGALESVLGEMSELQRRTALDMSSAAATLRALSDIDLSSRRAAAESFGPVFRAASGFRSFIIYLHEGAAYLPVWGIEGDTALSTKTIEPLSPNAAQSMICSNEPSNPTSFAHKPDMLRNGCAFGFVQDDPSSPSAVIVCCLDPLKRTAPLRRRADDATRLFEAILGVVPEQPWSSGSD